MVTVAVHPPAFLEEHLSVAALPSRHKEDEVMTSGKSRDVRHAVRHLSADSIEALEGCCWRDVSLYILYYTVKLIERLSSLRVKVYITGEVQFLHLIEVLYHDGSAMCLSDESEHLRMTVLSEDHYLRVVSVVSHISVILPFYPLLQLEYHGTGGIDDLDIVALCQQVSLWRFAVSAQQHLGIVQPAQVVVVDGDESHVAQPFALHAVVHDVAQAIECIALGQFLLSFLDGSGHSETEAAADVDFYFQK
mgnify:CR=1 FL=1